jgi:DNA-directed RNA polymerase subunit RPC12/RpoP
MPKIQEFIIKNNVKPKDCVYHTWRDAKNSKKQPTGKIRVLVAKSDSIARCEYTCPECKHQGYIETEWKRPFYVKCEKCKFKISVPRMREEAKKEVKSDV